MRTVQQGPAYVELHPETKDDLAILRRAFPHCMPSGYVCLVLVSPLPRVSINPKPT